MIQNRKASAAPEAMPKPGRTRTIRLGNFVLAPHCHCHICAFFSSPEEEYRVLLPFVKDGLAEGEKAFHTVNPRRREDHLRHLAAAGIDVTALNGKGQLEVRNWTEIHLRDGHFDQDKTLAAFGDILQKNAQEGFPLTRFVTHMEWALEKLPGVDGLLEYEAKANYAWLNQEGPVHPVICTYDLTKFSGEVVVDVMRTHPMVIIGGILQENPFYVPPDKFLLELQKRRSTRMNIRSTSDRN